MRIKEYCCRNGVMLTIRKTVQGIQRVLFSRMIIWGRTDLSIDASARILGLSNIKIGRNFNAGQHLWLEAITHYRGNRYNPVVEIGDNVSACDFVHIGATHHIKIGNNVLMGSNIYITDHNHGCYRGNEQSHPSIPPIERLLDSNLSVLIDDNVWIGNNVTILPGVSVGRGSILAAGAVVTKDVPQDVVVAGVPAVIIKMYNNQLNKWVSSTDKQIERTGTNISNV